MIKVAETDLDLARRLTTTSNTQSPTNSKDLRAVDASHRRIAEWLDSHFDSTYIFRRGDRAARGAASVTMKDIAQAYVAYGGEPNVAFSRAGSIFAQTTYYDAVFPGEDIAELHEIGDAEMEKDFVADRLYPALLLVEIRRFMNGRVAAGEDRKWKSLTYHLLWVLGEASRASSVRDSLKLLENIEAIVNGLLPMAYRALHEFVVNSALDIPRDLKSGRLLEKLTEAAWFDNSLSAKELVAAFRALSSP